MKSHGGTMPVAPVDYVKLWMVARSFVLCYLFCGKVRCPGRIFPSITQLEHMIVSQLLAPGNHDVNHPVWGERRPARSPMAQPPQWLAWDSLPNPPMGPSVVEILLILSHHAMEMPLAQNQEVVQTSPPYATQKSYSDRVCLRCFTGCPHDLNPCS
jgi:hypothetical protein